MLHIFLKVNKICSGHTQPGKGLSRRTRGTCCSIWNGLASAPKVLPARDALRRLELHITTAPPPRRHAPEPAIGAGEAGDRAPTSLATLGSERPTASGPEA